jgi:tetratricopeptide (TPR) repeat protein
MKAVALLAVVAVLAAGCASPQLAAARRQFWTGGAGEAAHTLRHDRRAGKHDRVLLLMERGMASFALGRYGEAAKDWIRADEYARDLEYFSLTRQTASLVINDETVQFLGAPHERALLHTFAALAFLSMGEWEEAAVEARRLAARLENLQGFPDDAFSHYVAGLCFEIFADSEAARLEYQRAGALAPGLGLDPFTGRMKSVPAPAAAPTGGCELVCFVLAGQAPSSDGAWPTGSGVARLNYGVPLGASRTLTSVADLVARGDARLADLRAAKTVTRIVMKEALASAVEKENEALGAILRLLLFALETPDTRRWETLPQWLGVARFPCPADLGDFDVVFENGVTRRTRPLARSGKLFVAVCRDLAVTERNATEPRTAR